MITVTVPATSANVGAGFDSLGLALSMHNVFTFEECDRIRISSVDGTHVPTGANNLVYRSARAVYDQLGIPLRGLRITQRNDIPMARGLGSSSACIVAGILGANALLGNKLTSRQMLTLATAIEGHPDNVAPAMLGGFVTSVYDEGQVYSVKKNIDEQLAFAAFVPDFRLLTSKARAALPDMVSHKDAVYNLSRAALATAAFCDGDYSLLGVATKDSLHQKYRLPLIDGGDEMFELAQDLGALAVYISGAGPTIMAVVPRDDQEFFARAQEALPQSEKLKHFTVYRLLPDNTGATVKEGNREEEVFMGLIVQKFGGTSVKDRDRIFNVARIVANTRNQGNDVVVVVSAQGDTTDDLITKAAEITSDPSHREMDMLLATGEQISISLLAMALQEIGVPSVSLTGWQAGFNTDRAYTKARIKRLNTERVESELARNRVVVVAGFQGLNRSDDITTLGRGGSDTSAVALAAALHADRCQIYTDVEGVYTADPRKIPKATRLKEITFDEMLELASLGAQVLNNRSVELAKKYGVELEVLSSINPVPGTVVKEETKVEGMLIKGVAKDEDVAVVSILEVPDVPGMSFKVFSLLAQKNINVDIILQSSGSAGCKDVIFTCSKGEAETARAVLESNKTRFGTDKITVNNDCAKVSIVGAGMQSHPGTASTMFEALYSQNINIHMISTSEIKISVIIDKADADRAVAAIHDAFIQ